MWKMPLALLLASVACGSRQPVPQIEADEAPDANTPVAEVAATEVVGESGGGLAADLAGLADAMPAGWSYTIDDPGDSSLPFRAAEVTFDNPGLECVIRFGENQANSRTEQPRVTLFVYRTQDAQALQEAEEPFREISSHCPRDLRLAETAKYYIAVSPCDRAFAVDESCARAVEELEGALRTFFSQFPAGGSPQSRHAGQGLHETAGSSTR